MMEKFRHIVRLMDTDLDGFKKVPYALRRIRGVGVTLGWAIARGIGVDPNRRIGELSDEELKRIETALKEPSKFNIPSWMFNRRKDLETGGDVHLMGSDLELRIKQDIDFMKSIRSWRGWRHSLGLKVRGQKTRTTGRTGRTVGVQRKKVSR
ncbi:30S ribosomal protein S13 [Candidatus Bathyarchaeota archaeon]|nr:30S ribosomal protein S13 [Candidatus Bathyarchaeota archaeon]MBS7618294.1 30S ribosomal protein S13 [Candidatus Bathyarchaeota archaeon]